MVFALLEETPYCNFTVLQRSLRTPYEDIDCVLICLIGFQVEHVLTLSTACSARRSFPKGRLPRGNYMKAYPRILPDPGDCLGGTDWELP